MSERKGTKALELWCKRLIRDCPEIQIDNMTTSWRNGMAFCALVHHFRPDLIDMSKLKPENIYENNQLAFSVAEKHLGIPALLDPEDMVENDVPDRLSILTYLSQFYQRLGHTVKTKVSENESKSSKTTTEPAQPPAPIKFGKTGLDKCMACSLPVYLAQRLMVSHKLYHRRCFRCSKCSGHLNPKNYHVIEGSEFLCDSCKNEKTLLKYFNNNDHDQMGMLAFSDDAPDAKLNASKRDLVSPKQKSRPSSILEKISMFENNDKEITINNKTSNRSLTDSTNISYKELSRTDGSQSDNDSKHTLDSINAMSLEIVDIMPKSTPEKVYKSNIDKFNFLQTQLSDDSILDTDKSDKTAQSLEISDTKHNYEDCIKTEQESPVKVQDEIKDSFDNNIKDEIHIAIKEDTNITDDIRIAKIPTTTNLPIEEKDNSLDDIAKTEITTTPSVSVSEKEPYLEDTSKPEVVTISVPPRRKKQQAADKLNAIVKKEVVPIKLPKEYPVHLNPFSDDEEEEEPSKKESTNPFGSTDEEDDEVPPKHLPPKVPGIDTSTPVKRLIAVNPFWSDGEEPSSDEEDEHSRGSKGTYSSLASSTPNLPGSTPQRKKTRAPLPPTITVNDTLRSHATSMDDVASISSLSSYNSTVHSDQKSFEKSTPRLKKRLAPTPPDSLSTASGHGGSIDKGVDTSGKNTSGSDGGKKKGPAPGLPLPERREVKLQMSPEELQVQLDLLETQQLGLERQGVLIEKMIRDKCEGDEATPVPQEEVEDLVIQLCELVNEKNDLFRKQTELMYIRRQQRLEQEQADIEHEIRIIQSRPAVNRIDADKAREEQLVSRLVQMVRMRDELVQQLDAERRRERQEDLAIAASIANKRAQRNSDSNSSSMKSSEVSASATPKKSKVKDKVKKQFKKAKHTLISKKKDDSAERKEGKEDKVEKEKKSK